MSSYVKRADGTIVFVVHFTFKPGRDDRLIQIVENARPRQLASLLRQLMNRGIIEKYNTTRKTKLSSTNRPSVCSK